MPSLSKLFARFMQRNLARLMNLYPPYLGAGIRVAEMSDDRRYVRVEMTLRFYNRNYVGTHYGGSLFSMCDPFYMLMVLENLGPDYVVWDRRSTIEFKKPGRGRVRAEFVLTPERIEEIRKQAATGEKVEPQFAVDILDEEDEVVATVDKTLYVRRKRDRD